MSRRAGFAVAAGALWAAQAAFAETGAMPDDVDIAAGEPFAAQTLVPGMIEVDQLRLLVEKARAETD